MTVPSVALLNLAHSRLQVSHCPHLPQLLDGEWQSNQANNYSEDDNRDAHVVEADGVKHHQQVQHGSDYYFSPEVVDSQKGPTLLPASYRKCAHRERVAGKSSEIAQKSIAYRVLVVPAPHLYLSSLDLDPSHTAVFRADIHRFPDGYNWRPNF